MTFCTPVHSEQHLHLHGHSCHESWRGTHQIHNYTTSYYDPTGWGRKDYIRRLTKTFKLFTWSLTSNQCTLSHRRHHRMCDTEQMGWTLWCGQEHGTQECCCPVSLPPSCHSTQHTTCDASVYFLSPTLPCATSTVELFQCMAAFCPDVLPTTSTSTCVSGWTSTSTCTSWWTSTSTCASGTWTSFTGWKS